MPTIPTWPMPLNAPPCVVLAGVAVHERNPVERWLLPTLWTLHFYSYEADLILDGTPHLIRPGMAGIIAPGVRQEYRYRGPSTHVYAHFSLPPSPTTQPAPVLIDLGDAFPAYRARLEEVAGSFDLQPQRVSARVWSLLWDLAALASERSADLDVRVARAIAFIERRLGSSLPVEEIAAYVGISHNQLIRLFRRHLGLPVVAYIRKRRVDRAMHLLRATDLPLAEVGRRLGIQDPSAFSRLVRTISGRNPRRIRRAAR